DIEGSTRLLQALGERYADLLSQQREILRGAFQRAGGSEVDSQGDAFFYVFPRAMDAVRAAVDAQEAILEHEWPEGSNLRIRMALHTGESLELGPEGYVGMDVHRAARIAHAGHGGQILLSPSTSAIIEPDLPEGFQLQDLGEHRLKDLRHPLHLFQVRSQTLPSHFPPLRSLDSLPNNLPHQLTTFVGRQAEVGQVIGLLKESRLVTLVGPGGAGKSRLSLQVGAELVDSFQHGVWFVELAALDTPQFLVSAIVGALPFQIDVHSSDLPAEAQLLDYLRNRSCLLLMDNFEHLLPGGELLLKILDAAPDVRFIVTSRERLNLREEWVFDLAGMNFPRNGDRAPTQFSAVKLFLERARQIQPDFDPSPEEQRAIIEICKLVEGMPLAIELAAAWLRTLSVEEITSEIETNVDILRTSARNQPDKHRSLRAVFDHSWALLSEDERAGYMKLSVFRGGFPRSAAQAIAGTDLALLSGLIDKSLVRREGAERFALHELLRQYAWEKLASENDTVREVRERHCRYYLDFIESQKPKLDTPNAIEAREEILIELNNIRAATFFAITQMEEGPARQMLANLSSFYNLHGFQEGVEAFQAFVEQLESSADSQPAPSVLLAAKTYLASLMSTLGSEGGESLARSILDELRIRDMRQELAVCLQALGIYAEVRSSYDEAVDLLSESLELVRGGKDIFFVTSVLLWLGWAHYEKGDYQRAQRCFEEGLSLSAGSGQRLGEAFSLSKLGTLADAMHDYREALVYHQRAQDIFLEFDDDAGQGYALSRMSLSAWGLNDFTAAEEYARQGMAHFESIGHRWGMVTSLCRLGFAALGQGKTEAALDVFYESLERSLDYKYLSTRNYALIGIASVWCRMGELERGIQLLQLTLERPETPGLYRDIARAQLGALRDRIDDNDLELMTATARELEIDEIASSLVRAREPSTPEGLEVKGI
ncbi:MAG: tetratricopeptide repeat protein, partial [Anaerolineales bacterium]